MGRASSLAMSDAERLWQPSAGRIERAGITRYLRWLEDRHMAEVIKEPGFLWARKCRLEQTDDKGWQGYLLIYGLGGLLPIVEWSLIFGPILFHGAAQQAVMDLVRSQGNTLFVEYLPCKPHLFCGIITYPDAFDKLLFQ